MTTLTRDASVRGIEYVSLLARLPQYAPVEEDYAGKLKMLEAIADLPDQAQARIVGSHPMAGREVSGARGAQGNLFVDRP